MVEIDCAASGAVGGRPLLTKRIAPVSLISARYAAASASSSRRSTRRFVASTQAFSPSRESSRLSECAEMSLELQGRQHRTRAHQDGSTGGTVVRITQWFLPLGRF